MVTPAWSAQEACLLVSQIPVSGQTSGEISVPSTSHTASTTPSADICASQPVFFGVHQNVNAWEFSAGNEFCRTLMVVQPPVSGLPSSAAPSLSYNISQSVKIPTKQHSQSSIDINHNSDYQTFRKKWGNDPRFVALDRRNREQLFNERVLTLKKAAEEKGQAIRAAAAASFESMLQEQGDITVNSRWSRDKLKERDW